MTHVKTQLQNASTSEKTILSVFAVVGLILSVWIVFWFSLSTLAKIVFICILLGFIYLPVRLILGASLLPTRSPIPVTLGSTSRFEFLITALFLAFLHGYVTVIAALFLFGCIVTPIQIMESLLSISLMPSWPRDVFWPLIGMAFIVGVTSAAIRDVREEKTGQ